MDHDLPPGQRALTQFPRFGLSQFASRFPKQTEHRGLKISGAVASELLIADVFAGLERIEQVSDFHCVTTWSRQGLRWSGVRFADFHRTIVVPKLRPDDAAITLILRAQDGARTTLLLEDALQPDVLLVDRLDDAPLGIEHGAPLRLIAPRQYGYKSVKHLSSIEYCVDASGFRPSAFRFMDHPRARVALEERGRGFPGWFLRFLYRPLVGPTVRRFARAMAERRGAQSSA
jgi:DMSO/TMAO reductase YedYZ molybdopterin-dependent catalytic subunit